MNGQEQFDRFLGKYPHAHRSFSRPHWTRRQFIELAGTGLTASILAGHASASDIVQQGSVSTIGKAKNVIFVLLAGAPSHTDTFDLKVVPGVTPDAVKPDTIKGVLWPTGILPKLGDTIDDLAIVRSLRAW